MDLNKVSVNDEIKELTLMCWKVKLTGLVLRLVLVMLGSVADTTSDIMVLVLVSLLKRLGFRMLPMLL